MTVNQNKVLVGSKTVRKRYDDASDMTLWRWLRDPNLRFPQPIRINGRRFWDTTELDEFDASRKERPAA